MILEHESNYQFVHSAWHISMAVAILFLLPQSPVDQGKSLLNSKNKTNICQICGYFIIFLISYSTAVLSKLSVKINGVRIEPQLPPVETASADPNT